MYPAQHIPICTQGVLTGMRKYRSKILYVRRKILKIFSTCLICTYLFHTCICSLTNNVCILVNVCTITISKPMRTHGWSVWRRRCLILGWHLATAWCNRQWITTNNCFGSESLIWWCCRHKLLMTWIQQWDVELHFKLELTLHGKWNTLYSSSVIHTQ